MGNSSSTTNSTTLKNAISNEILMKTETEMTTRVDNSFKGECKQNISAINNNEIIIVEEGAKFEQNNVVNGKMNCAFESLNEIDLEQKLKASLEQAIKDEFDMKLLVKTVNEQKNDFFGWASNQTENVNNTNIENAVNNKFMNEVKNVINTNINNKLVTEAKQKISTVNNTTMAWVKKNAVARQNNKISATLSVAVTQKLLGKMNQEFTQNTKLDLSKATRVDISATTKNKQDNNGVTGICASYSSLVSVVVCVALIIVFMVMGGSES